MPGSALESHFLWGILVMLLLSRGRYVGRPWMLAVLLLVCLGGMVALLAADYGGCGDLVSGVGHGAFGPLVGAGLAG